MSWKRELLLSSDWILMQCEIINSHFPSNITRALDVTQYTRARVLSSSIMRNSNDDETSQSIRQIKRLNIFFYLTEKLNHFLVASHSRTIAVQHFRQHNMPQLIIGRWILMSFSVYSWNERQQKKYSRGQKINCWACHELASSFFWRKPWKWDRKFFFNTNFPLVPSNDRRKHPEGHANLRAEYWIQWLSEWMSLAMFLISYVFCGGERRETTGHQWGICRAQGELISINVCWFLRHNQFGN